MDAVEYLKERERMLVYEDEPGATEAWEDFEENNPAEAVCAVEEWVKEHPRMTNRMKFVEVFGRMMVDSLVIVDRKKGPYLSDWWDAEYKEPEAGT